MARLTARTPAADLLPLTIGGLTISEFDPGPVTAIMPYPGVDMADASGLDWPDPGGVTTRGDARAVWAGLDTVYLLGAGPDEALADRAALVDQSDAWTWIALEGAGLGDVMARLTPLDLRQLPVGHVARTLVGHMSALLIRPRDDRIEIAVFRSMAGTLCHEVERAARIVSTRMSHDL